MRQEPRIRSWMRIQSLEEMRYKAILIEPSDWEIKRYKVILKGPNDRMILDRRFLWEKEIELKLSRLSEI